MGDGQGEGGALLEAYGRGGLCIRVDHLVGGFPMVIVTLTASRTVELGSGTVNDGLIITCVGYRNGIDGNGFGFGMGAGGIADAHGE